MRALAARTIRCTRRTATERRTIVRTRCVIAGTSGSPGSTVRTIGRSPSGTATASRLKSIAAEVADNATRYNGRSPRKNVTGRRKSIDIAGNDERGGANATLFIAVSFRVPAVSIVISVDDEVADFGGGFWVEGRIDGFAARTDRIKFIFSKGETNVIIMTAVTGRVIPNTVVVPSTALRDASSIPSLAWTACRNDRDYGDYRNGISGTDTEIISSRSVIIDNTRQWFIININLAALGLPSHGTTSTSLCYARITKISHGVVAFSARSLG